MCLLEHDDYSIIIFLESCKNKKIDVYFYRKNEDYYEFTNFYKYAPFVLDGKQWSSTEHYFQAQKFVGTPYEEYIRYARSPREAFELSRKHARWQRNDWDEIKLQIMYKALLAKFIQNLRLRQLLLSTGTRPLVEHTYNDSFWGDGGGYGHGSNHLGQLLEKVRDVVREQNSKELENTASKHYSD